VHDPLGNALAVELGQLLDEVLVLQQDRSVRPGGLGILVIGDGAPDSVVRMRRAGMVILLAGEAVFRWEGCGCLLARGT